MLAHTQTTEQQTVLKIGQSAGKHTYRIQIIAHTHMHTLIHTFPLIYPPPSPLSLPTSIPFPFTLLAHHRFCVLFNNSQKQHQ